MSKRIKNRIRKIKDCIAEIYIKQLCKKTMIFNLSQDLGNQLFQYATIKSIMKENGFKAGFSLGLVNCHYKNFSHSLSKLQLRSLLSGRKFRIIKKLSIRHRLTEVDHLQNEKFVFIADNIEYRSRFDNIRAELQEEFTLKKRYCDVEYLQWLNKLKGQNSVVIHIEENEFYLNNLPGQPFKCPLDYYQKALQYIEEKLAEPHLYIFTDNIELVKQYFPSLHCDIKLCSSNSITDLLLRSFSRYNVISNSYSSWWSAFLNKNGGKNIIASSEATHQLKCNFFAKIIPDEWIKL